MEFGWSDDLLRINVITPALLFGLSLKLEEADGSHLHILSEDHKSLERVRNNDVTSGTLPGVRPSLLTKWKSPVVEHQSELDPDTVTALDLHLGTTFLSPLTLL